MISFIIRKLISFLSIFFKNNKINSKKDKKILNEIRYLLVSNKTDFSLLKETHKVFNKKIYELLKNNNLKNFLRVNFVVI